MRTKTGLKSIVLLISDRIAAASRGPNKSLLNQGWIRRQCFAIRSKPEFCWKIDVDALNHQSALPEGCRKLNVSEGAKRRKNTAHGASRGWKKRE